MNTFLLTVWCTAQLPMGLADSGYVDGRVYAACRIDAVRHLLHRTS
jgi:hypothetical protein